MNIKRLYILLFLFLLAGCSNNKYADGTPTKSIFNNYEEKKLMQVI